MNISPKKVATDYIESLPDDASFDDIIKGLRSLSVKEGVRRLSTQDQQLLTQLVQRLAEINKTK